MKKQAPLIQLAYGKRGNLDSVPMGENYCKLLDNVIKYDNKMHRQLESLPEIAETYKKYTDAIEDLNVVTADDHYIEGFSFGVLLGIDIANTGRE